MSAPDAPMDSSLHPNQPHESHAPTKMRISNYHHSLYFAKGDIVLLSLLKDDVLTAFKVYKDFLILHSPVFEDMLSLPSPPSVERYDGVPLVRLHDEAKHLVPFLRAIYDPNAIPSSDDFDFSLDKVESVLRLSKKYQFEKLLKCVRKTLSRKWPKNFFAWTALIEDTKNEILRDHGAEVMSPLPEPCGAIRLARDYDIPEILPAAFYFLLFLSPEVFSPTDSCCVDWYGPVEAKLMCLPHDDLICFVQGSHATRKFAYRFFTESNCVPTEHCITQTKCLKVFRALGEVHTLKAARSDRLEYDPLEFLQTRSMDSFDMKTEGMCDECREWLTSGLSDWGSKLWESLPEFFDLKTE